MLSQNQIGVLYMVGSVICFSIMDICVKWLDYYPVGQVLFLRFFIGFIPIIFIIPRNKLLTFYKTSRPGLHAFRAITGALAIIALFIGLSELPLADVVSLTFGGPIFVTVASIFFLSESWHQKMVSSFFRFYWDAVDSTTSVFRFKLLLSYSGNFLHFFCMCCYQC